MSTPPEVLLRTLEDLEAEEFKKFKWFLWHEEALENFPAIPVSVLENADRMDTVDKMSKKYCDDTIKVTVMVLEKISRNDLVQKIHKKMKEPAVTLQSESHRVEKLQKPAAEEHQLITTRRSADERMDMKGKKSIVLLGNRNPLKKTSLSVSDVQHQIEKLHMTTEKPEQDSMNKQPLTCSRTDLLSRGYRVEKLQKPAVDEHQLTPTKRPADDWMDTTVKKSIVLLGNGEYLKKALITNILGRDLSTLTNRTILRRTQVYEDDVYKFICTPDLDKDSRDIRDVFSTIQRPDMSLLVVEDDFIISDVQRQIEKLQKMTGKPEEDFIVLLPRTCKNTNLPFTWTKVEYLIRELQKPAADEHQLTTTRRSDSWMPTTGKRSVAVVTLVLLGMAGNGKSATGNTILGEQRFYSTASSLPVTRDVHEASTDIDKTHVRLIDTPDLFDDDMKSSDRNKLVARCKQLCGSGPLVYLLVFHVSRFMDEERESLEKMEKMFGREAKDKTVILFTHSGDLENSKMSFQDFLNDCQPKLKEITQKCGNRCVLFENKNQSSQQVNELMEMVFRLLDDQRKH